MKKKMPRGKLREKNLDMIVLNSLKDEGAGFQKDTNKIKILTQTEQKEFSLKSKRRCSKRHFGFCRRKIQ